MYTYIYIYELKWDPYAWEYGPRGLFASEDECKTHRHDVMIQLWEESMISNLCGAMSICLKIKEPQSTSNMDWFD